MNGFTTATCFPFFRFWLPHKLSINCYKQLAKVITMFSWRRYAATSLIERGVTLDRRDDRENENVCATFKSGRSKYHVEKFWISCRIVQLRISFLSDCLRPTVCAQFHSAVSRYILPIARFFHERIDTLSSRWNLSNIMEMECSRGVSVHPGTKRLWKATGSSITMTSNHTG